VEHEARGSRATDGLEKGRQQPPRHDCMRMTKSREGVAGKCRGSVEAVDTLTNSLNTT
jgi:hypothetical protein